MLPDLRERDVAADEPLGLGTRLGVRQLVLVLVVLVVRVVIVIVMVVRHDDECSDSAARRCTT